MAEKSHQRGPGSFGDGLAPHMGAFPEKGSRTTVADFSLTQCFSMEGNLASQGTCDNIWRCF